MKRFGQWEGDPDVEVPPDLEIDMTVPLSSAIPAAPIYNRTNVPKKTSESQPTDYASVIFTGPFLLGQALKKGQTSSVDKAVLLGTFVNLAVLGWVINSVSGRPAPLDPFGIFVAGAAQVTAGILITPLPAAETAKK